MFNQKVIEKLKVLTGKKHIVFMNKCREAAELLMRYAKEKDYNSLILQEEGGWHTYEKSAKKLGLDVIKAEMNKGALIKEKFPQKKALIILNTNPGYAYIEPLTFYDEMKKTQSIIVNDVVSSIGDENSKKGDFIIGSFGKDKPLTISTGGAFIAFNNDDDLIKIKGLIENYYKDSGIKINFEELLNAINNLHSKKNSWIQKSNKIKNELKQKGFQVLNENDSINIFVKTKVEEKENLIKFCKEHGLEYQTCPLYIRTMQDAISIEIKKTKGD